jgi:hypothetical protein
MGNTMLVRLVLAMFSGPCRVKRNLLSYNRQHR